MKKLKIEIFHLWDLAVDVWDLADDDLVIELRVIDWVPRTGYKAYK